MKGSKGVLGTLFGNKNRAKDKEPDIILPNPKKGFFSFTSSSPRPKTKIAPKQATEINRKNVTISEWVLSNQRPVPKSFLCPISQNVFVDPVFASSGHTFERSYIQCLFDLKYDVCPVTLKKLPNLNLKSNNVIRAMIEDWCASHGVSLPRDNGVKEELIAKTVQNIILNRQESDDKNDGKIGENGDNGESRGSRENRGNGKMGEIEENLEYGRNRGNRGNRKNAENYRNQENVEDRRGEREEGFSNGHLERLNAYDNRGRGREGKRVENGEGKSHSEWEESGQSLVGGETGGRREKGDAIQREERRGGELRRGEFGEEDGSGNFSHRGKKIQSLRTERLQNFRKMMLMSPNVDQKTGNGSGAPLSPEGKARTSVFQNFTPVPGAIPGRRLATPVKDRLPTEFEIESAINAVKEGTREAKTEAMQKLRAASKHSWPARKMMAELGTIPMLVEVLKSRDVKDKNSKSRDAESGDFNSEDSKSEDLKCEDSSVLEWATAVLFNLAWEMELKKPIAAAGAIEPLVDIMIFGNTDGIRESALGAICNLSVVPANRELIFNLDVVPHLLSLLKKSRNKQERKDTLMGLANLAMEENCRLAMISADTVEMVLGLLDNLEEFGSEEEELALLIATLLKSGEACVRICEEDGVGILTRVLEGGSQKAQASSISSLLLIAKSSKEALAIVKQEAVLPSIVAVLDQGTQRSKEKANALVKLIRGQ